MSPQPGGRSTWLSARVPPGWALGLNAQRGLPQEPNASTPEGEGSARGRGTSRGHHAASPAKAMKEDRPHSPSRRRRPAGRRADEHGK